MPLEPNATASIVSEPSGDGPRVSEPIATYRIQLQPQFTFQDAADIAPYLAELGISHVYCSPYLQAAIDSSHGYDVVDASHVNTQLGGAEAHARFCATLHGLGLAQMIDIVPNHMAIAGKQNPWWWDVLENGPSSFYATYFDVDWEASEERWPNKVLLPVLGNHYGRILEDGQLELKHSSGVFSLHYHEHVFPIDPSSLSGLLARVAEACASELLAFIAESHARLPRPTVTSRHAVERRHRDKMVLLNLLTQLCEDAPEVRHAIDEEVGRLNSNPDALDILIEQQNYRLAFWRTAARDLGYRRFFDINDLAGLRVEHLEVFKDIHRLPFKWIKQGHVQGLRVDHPDGLRNPTEYFHRLRDACPDTWILAEKILEPGETLPTDWPIAGTTGYEFLNLVGGLAIDPQAEEAMSNIYKAFVGPQWEEGCDFHTLVCICKRLVLTQLLDSELSRLSNLFVTICERHRRHRDYTRHEMRDAICEAAIHFPVYRTYVSNAEKRVGESDKRYINDAISAAQNARPDMDPEIFLFLKELLLLRIDGERENELAMRFQQLTGPAMAKGLEDTAFYRYHRLVSLNEVGGDPSCFGTSVAEFHQRCITAQAERPRALLASTTHDTKRSEDVRARLALLSEIPYRWAQIVERWATHNDNHRVNRDEIDSNTEYLFYQTLVGAWPISTERITEYMLKAMREAKVHTSWTAQGKAYESQWQAFIEEIMKDKVFISELTTFVEPLIAPGRINSLAQSLIKMTAPGVPDIYQGTELWDLSLVDPDNRRPVDYSQRRQLLKRLEEYSIAEIIAQMDSGAPKLWLIQQALRLRNRHPNCFGPGGTYQPLEVEGQKQQHVVAYLRSGKTEKVAVVTPRLVLGLAGDWADTTLHLPEGKWHNVLSKEDVSGGTIRVGTLLACFPVALLEKRG